MGTEDSAPQHKAPAAPPRVKWAEVATQQVRLLLETLASPISANWRPQLLCFQYDCLLTLLEQQPQTTAQALPPRGDKDEITGCHGEEPGDWKSLLWVSLCDSAFQNQCLNK